jgi:hypothetical protein
MLVLSTAIVFGGSVDAFVVESAHAIWFVPVLAIVMIVCYPAPDRWTNAYGDTTLIIGTGVGVLLASSRGTHSLTPSLSAPCLFSTKLSCGGSGPQRSVSFPFQKPIGCGKWCSQRFE